MQPSIQVASYLRSLFITQTYLELGENELPSMPAFFSVQINSRKDFQYISPTVPFIILIFLCSCVAPPNPPQFNICSKLKIQSIYQFKNFQYIYLQCDYGSFFHSFSRTINCKSETHNPRLFSRILIHRQDNRIKFKKRYCWQPA